MISENGTMVFTLSKCYDTEFPDAASDEFYRRCQRVSAGLWLFLIFIVVYFPINCHWLKKLSQRLQTHLPINQRNEGLTKPSRYHVSKICACCSIKIKSQTSHFLMTLLSHNFPSYKSIVNTVNVRRLFELRILFKQILFHKQNVYNYFYAVYL